MLEIIETYNEQITDDKHLTSITENTGEENKMV
jgi:hypothetical protein